MKTVKEMKKELEEYGYGKDFIEKYMNGYISAIKGILLDIEGSSTISVKSIEMFLKNLTNK